MITDEGRQKIVAVIALHADLEDLQEIKRIMDVRYQQLSNWAERTKEYDRATSR